MKKLRNATFFQFKTNQHFVFRYSLIFFFYDKSKLYFSMYRTF